MLSVARKFVAAVVDRARDQPVGLVMTGLPGIGKTHLCVAAAEQAAEAGANVLLLDSNSVGLKYKQLCEKEGGMISNEVLNELFDEWISGTDLIVFDDFNNQNSMGNRFFKKALEYVITNNKAILVSSNERVNVKERLPGYIGYDDPAADNFLVLSGLEGKSYSKEWWSEEGEVVSTDIAKMSSQEKIRLLAKYKGERPAGVVVVDRYIDLDKIRKYLELENNDIAADKVRVVDDDDDLFTMANTVSADYDVFIMGVRCSVSPVRYYDECKQLLNLIPKMYDAGGKKFIVVTNDQKNLGDLIETLLMKGSEYKKEKQRLIDRMQHLFLGGILPLEKQEVRERK